MARPRTTDEQRAMQHVFGQNVRHQRNEAGPTQEALAEALSVSREYISDVEHGKVNVSMTRIVEIAAAVNASVASLFLGLDEHADRP